MILDPHQAEAEALFAEYLRGMDGETGADPARFLAGTQSEVAERFRVILDDYTVLRRQTWSAGIGLTPGRRIAGFRLVRAAGSGACGSVWEAEQEALARRIALTILHPHLHLSERALRRFRLEAAAAARLEHPAIVRILEVGEEDGVAYLAQELVEGGSLAERLAARRSAPESARFDDYREIARIFARLAEALDVAHGAGIVHRDVKPANILFDVAGEPRLVDFGLALVADDAGATWSGGLAGTLAYASPEQLRDDRQRPDARSDVFSLGATLYEALTLRRAFEGDTHELLMRRVLTEDPPDPRSLRARIPRDLAVICLKALEKSPSRRYASAGELGADLRAFLEGRPILARPAGRVERALRWCRRHPAVAGTIAGLASSALIVGVLLMATLQARGASQRLLGMTLDLLAFADPGSVRTVDLPDAEELRALIGSVLDNDPRQRAEAFLAVGTTYRAHARYDEAAEFLRESLWIFTAELGANDPQRRVALGELARVHEEAWDHSLAAELLQEALELELEEPQPSEHDVARIAGRLHRVLVHQEAKDEIRALDARLGGLEQLLRRVIEGAGSTLDGAALRTSLGRLLLDRETPDEARDLAEEALADLRQTLVPEHHPVSLEAIDLAADSLCALREHEESERRYRRLMELTRASLGQEHPHYLHAVWGTGEELQEQGRFPEAEEEYLQAIEGLRDAFGAGGVPLLLVRRGHAILLMRTHRFEEALRVIDEIELPLENALGSTHLDVVIARRARIAILHAQGRLEEARLLLLGQIDRQIEGRGESHHQTLNTLTYMAHNATARGEFGEAVSWCRDALDFGSPLDERSQAGLRAALVMALTTDDRLDEARQELARAADVLGDDSSAVLLARGDLAAAEGDERTARACYDAWELTDDAARDGLGERHAALAVRRALLGVRVENTDAARTELREAQAALHPWQVDWRLR